MRAMLVGNGQIQTCAGAAKHTLCAPPLGAEITRMQRTNAHVVVLGNEKGGSGKSTTAFHLAVHLLYEGFRVATIDTDSRQRTFTAYVRNRSEWAKAHGLNVPHPIHFHLPQTRSDSAEENARLD